MYSEPTIIVSDNDKNNALSIRCVRDVTVTDYTPCPAGEHRIGNLIWAKSNLTGNKTFGSNEDADGAYFK